MHLQTRCNERQRFALKTSCFLICGASVLAISSTLPDSSLSLPVVHQCEAPSSPPPLPLPSSGSLRIEPLPLPNSGSVRLEPLLFPNSGLGLYWLSEIRTTTMLSQPPRPSLLHKAHGDVTRHTKPTYLTLSKQSNYNCLGFDSDSSQLGPVRNTPSPGRELATVSVTCVMCREVILRLLLLRYS